MKHILIDSYGCSTERIDNLMDVYEVINKVINIMGVKAIMPPQLIPYYYCEEPEDVGISAFVLLKGGHFTIHTFPKYGCYFADLLYDGFADAKTLEALLTREFPCDSFFMKPIHRDEFDKNDMGIYQTADFGPHYLIRAKAEKAPTIDEYMDMLDRIPYKVNMHPICRPYVLRDTVDNPSYLSGIVVIAESHIALHYNYKTGEVLMDIFSCKTVDEQKYQEVMATLFDSYEDVLILRGRKNAQRKDTQHNKYETHKTWQDVITEK
ncbi:MAG: S-adenosylmethionine decarboxylase [Clostridia bacterium]|nr:S-adenosylmethionine decarboxylase [Clostridia bacterium]